MRKYSKRKFVKNKRPSGKAKGSKIKKRKSTNRTKNRGKNRKRTMRGGTNMLTEHSSYLEFLRVINSAKATQINQERADFLDAGKAEENEFNAYREELKKKGKNGYELKEALITFIAEKENTQNFNIASQEEIAAGLNAPSVFSDRPTPPNETTNEITNADAAAMVVQPVPDNLKRPTPAPRPPSRPIPAPRPRSGQGK